MFYRCGILVHPSCPDRYKTPNHPHTKIWVSSLNKVRKRIMERGPPPTQPTFLEIARIVLAAREPLEQCRLNKNS